MFTAFGTAPPLGCDPAADFRVALEETPRNEMFEGVAETRTGEHASDSEERMEQALFELWRKALCVAASPSRDEP